MKKLISITLAALMALSLFAACGKTNDSNDKANDSKSEVTGTVSTDGSTSMEKVIMSLGESFQAKNKGISVGYNPTGSGSGITAVSEGRCDIGLSSRALKDDEKASGLKETVLALDGIAIIVNPENKVSDLTLEQIAKIYTGQITNWKEVGGDDAEIVLIGREAGSGTRDGFESITGTKDSCKYRQELTSTGDVITTVAGNPNAIGYASLASVKDSVKALSVGGVAPTEATVSDGTYAVQRPFVLVTKEGAELSAAAEPSYGILPFILTSIYGTAGAILLGVPVGFMASVYLAKMAPAKIKNVVVEAVSLLAGIPSVVYGLVGMMVLVPGIRRVFNVPDGASLLAAIIVLAIMILPSIIKVSMTSLEAVPREYEDASLALGATPTETYFRVSVPAAKSGIAAAVVLGVGRAIGEAMAVMMVSGNVPNMPELFQSVRFLTTAVASEMSYSSGLQRQALFSIALVLFLFIMLINATLNFLLKKDKSNG